MDRAFEEDTVYTASEKGLRSYMRLLCYEAIDNDRIRHRQIIRALTINYVLTAQFIEKANNQNWWLGIIVAVITFFSLLASILQCLAAWL